MSFICDAMIAKLNYDWGIGIDRVYNLHKLKLALSGDQRLRAS